MGDDHRTLLCEGGVAADMVRMPVGVDDIAYRLIAYLGDAGDQPRYGWFILHVNQEQSVLAHREPDVETHISPVVTPGHIVETGRDLHGMVLASDRGLCGSGSNR